jgi:hypothetical protein
LKAASRFTAGAALAALLVISVPAGANESSANLETGGLVLIKNADIEMRSEDSYISDKAVRVKYVAEAQGISTPQLGNPERTAVMDGLRRFFGDGSLRFVVKTLKVAHTDKGVIAYTEAATAKGIGGVFLLTSDGRGMWKIGWREGQGTSDCATVAHSFGSAKVLIESYGIKPDALIPDFTENNYKSLQRQARHNPHDPCAFGLVGDPGELSH